MSSSFQLNILQLAGDSETDYNHVTFHLQRCISIITEDPISKIKLQSSTHKEMLRCLGMTAEGRK